MRILVVEDDQLLNKTLSYNLSAVGYSVDGAMSKAVAIRFLEKQDYDLIVLDVNLPDGNGFDICREVKERRPDTAVIFLTANDTESDMLKGFELGADDYICKPFRPRELLARINTVLRRKNGKSEFLSCKDITVDVQKAVVRKGNTELFLSALEYRLLLVFLQNPGVVFSRKKLLEMIWDVTGDFISDNTLTVYMKRLRDKIETNPQEPEILLTVRGLGYKAGE